MSQNNDFNKLIKTLVRDFMPQEDREKVTDNMIEEATGMALNMLPDFKKFHDNNTGQMNLESFKGMMKNMNNKQELDKIMKDTNEKIGKLKSLNKNVNEDMSQEELDKLMKETQEQIKQLEKEPKASNDMDSANEKINNFMKDINKGKNLPKDPSQITGQLDEMMKSLPNYNEEMANSLKNNLSHEELTKMNNEFSKIVKDIPTNLKKKKKKVKVNASGTQENKQEDVNIPQHLNKIKKANIQPIKISEDNVVEEKAVEHEQQNPAVNVVKINKKKISVE